MSDLVEFLLARIAEDEAETRYVGEDGGGWELGSYMDSSDDFPPVLTISRARVLAECEAKRGVVVAYLGLREAAKTAARAGSDEEATTGRNMYAGVELALRALAVPYADHPDYRQEWKL